MHQPQTSRASPCVLHHHMLDEIGTLQAVGFTGLIQATRDTTAAAYAAVQVVALPALAIGLLYLGITAWREGSAIRERSAGAALTQGDLGLLVLCLVLDLVGGASADASDLVWAPCSAFIVYALFDSPLLAAINAIKELLEFTDVLPVATLAWLLAYAYPHAKLTRTLGLRRMEDENSTRG